MKTKIDVIKWIKSNFKNADDLYSFCEYYRQTSIGLTVAQDNKLSDLLNSIKDLPPIFLNEICGQIRHTYKQTPLLYIVNHYSQDCKARDNIFK